MENPKQEKLLSYTRRIRQDSVGNLEELRKYIVARGSDMWSNFEGRNQPSGKVRKLRRPVQKIFPPEVLDKPEQTRQERFSET